MSATGRGTVRMADDNYATPPWAAELLVASASAKIVNHPRTVLEPGAGAGNVVSAARAAWPDAFIVAVEKREECRAPLLLASDAVLIGDLFDPQVQDRLVDLLRPHGGRFEAVVGNPPFGGPKWRRKAEGGGPNPTYGIWLDFVRLCGGLLAPPAYMKLPHLTFLLRLAVLEARERNEWMRTHVPDVDVLPDRPSFTGGQSDSTAYAFMSWPSSAFSLGGGRESGVIRVLRSREKE